MTRWPAALCVSQVLLASVLLLTACHPDAPSSAGAAARELRRGNGPEPDSLDPQLARSDSAAQIIRDCYEGLVSLDATAEPEPGVADHWQVSADGRTYTFHLRGDARWSNGTAVTADDFVRSWRRLVDPRTGAAYADVLKPVRGALAILRGEADPATLSVDALDSRTLRVELSTPVLYLPRLLAHWSTYPTFRGEAPSARAAVSNGAYALDQWVPGSHVLARRNRYYWNAARTHIDAVRYLHIADAADEYARYRAGELEVTYTVPQESLDQLLVRHGAELHRTPLLGLYFYGFNLTRAPFKDAPELRTALAMAVDRDQLVAHVTGLGETPAYQWVPPGMSHYGVQRFAWASLPTASRIARARELYGLAGYGPARPLSIELRYPSGSAHERIALAVAAMWKSVLGVETRLVAEEFRTLLAHMQSGDVELFRTSWIADYNDPSTFLDVMTSLSGSNVSHYRNPQYDAALEAAARIPEPEQRLRALEAAERQLLGDVPVIPLYHYLNKHLVSARVGGWYDNVLNVTYTKDLEWRHD